MGTRTLCSTLAAVALLGIAGAAGLHSAARAQQQTPPPPASTEKARAVEPGAMAALEKMGAYLRTLKTFTVRSENTTDEVLDAGQKIQFGGVVEFWVRAPDRMRADVSSDRKRRQFFYDGKTVTLYSPRLGYYATVPAAPTIARTIELMHQRYDLEVPLSDLFLWGTDKAAYDDIKSASLIGPSRIAGAECDHYAFQQDDVDWQVWIQRGKSPLPRKLVITTKDEPSQPQYVALLTWNLAPALADKAFAFVPGKDARRIVLQDVQAEAKK